MARTIAGFDWDHGNWPKCGKHGVGKAEIEGLFQAAPMVLKDRYPEEVESRFNAVGRTEAGGHLFVVFTLREKDGQTLIRPLSARRMHRKEIENLSERDKGKPFPVHQTNEAAERFTDTADLSEYDFSGFKPAQFEFQPKDARLEVRIPRDQLAALKAAARRRGIPHTRLVRQFIEEGIRQLEG